MEMEWKLIIALSPMEVHTRLKLSPINKRSKMRNLYRGYSLLLLLLQLELLCRDEPNGGVGFKPLDPSAKNLFVFSVANFRFIMSNLTCKMM